MTGPKATPYTPLDERKDLYVTEHHHREAEGDEAKEMGLANGKEPCTSHISNRNRLCVQIHFRNNL